MGIPRSLVRHFQRVSLRDSVSSLISAVRRLALPPDERFVTWKRTRAAAAAAAAAMRMHMPDRRSWSWWSSLLAALRANDDGSGEGVSGVNYVLGVLCVFVGSHCLSFGVLGQFRRRATDVGVVAEPWSTSASGGLKCE